MATKPLLPIPAFAWAQDPGDSRTWYSWVEGYDLFVSDRLEGRWQWSIDRAVDGTNNNYRLYQSVDVGEGHGYHDEYEAMRACNRFVMRMLRPITGGR